LGCRRLGLVDRLVVKLVISARRFGDGWWGCLVGL